MRLNAIQFAITAEDLTRALESGLTDPTDLYAETLKRIKGQHHQKTQLALKVLAWLSLVKRPLTIRELCHALGVQLCEQDFSRNQTPAPEIVLSSCFGLVIQDRHNHQVRLLHYTLLEFLEQNNLLEFGHQTVLETCLKCLSVPELKRLSFKERMTQSRVAAIQMQILRAYPFSEYASIYWLTHMCAEFESLDCLLTYLASSDKVVAWLRLFDFHDPKEYRRTFQISFFSHDPPSDSCIGIRVALAMGWHKIPPLVIARIESNKLELDAMLVRVSENKDSEVFETLLIRGLDPCYRGADEIPLLHQTVALDFSEGITILAKHGADLNQRDSRQQTPLQVGLDLGMEDCSRALMQRGADTNVSDSEGNTILHKAVMSVASESFIRTLLSYGSRTNARNILGETPLHLVLRVYRERTLQEAVVRVLLEHGSPVDAVAVDGYTVLHYACIWSWNLNTINMILVRFAAGLQHDQESLELAESSSSSIEASFTPTECADLLSLIASPSLESDTCTSQDERSFPLQFQQSVYEVIFRSILRCQTSINGIDSYQRTPLHHAVLTRRPYLAKFLLQAGVSASHQDYKGETALHIALYDMPDKGMMNVLLDQNVDALATNAKGYSVLELAMMSPSCATVLPKMLSSLRAGGARMKDGSSFLIGAIDHEQPVGIVEKILLYYPTEIDSRRANGDAALHIAINMRRRDVIELLLRNGANVSVIDHQGNSALHTVLMILPSLIERNWAYYRFDYIDMLLEYGADVDELDGASRTALQVAIAYKAPLDQVKKIVSRTRLIDRRDAQGSSALHAVLARLFSRVTPESWEYTCSLAQILLESGADIDVGNKSRQTPLHILAEAMSAPLISRVQPSLKSDFISHLANLLDILLRYDPDLQIRDHAGQTVLDILKRPNSSTHEVREYFASRLTGTDVQFRQTMVPMVWPSSKFSFE